MRKFFVERHETTDEVLARIMDAGDAEVRLVVPRNAALTARAANFARIRGETARKGMTVSVESVDDDALAFARESGMDAIHPLLASASGRALTDIVPVRGLPRISGVGPGAVRAVSVKKTKKAAPEKKKRSEALPEFPAVMKRIAVAVSETAGAPEVEAAETPVSEPRSRKRWLVGAGALAALLLVVWAGGIAFGRARVAVEFKKRPWEYKGEVAIRMSETKPNGETKSLPGEVFTETRNLTSLFPASGRVSTSEKARGKITIYNAYNTQTQVLVANTRFVAPDGKVFRLAAGVTVPGGKMMSGRIQPSSIEANIVADQPGADYNVGPIAKLTIPGFEGSPRYNGFYGEVKTPLTGGLTGEKAVATDADFAAARERTREMLQAGLGSAVLRNQPADFVVIDGASETAITKLSIVSSTAEGDKFGVFGEGRIRAVAFRESDMRILLAALANPEEGMTLAGLSITYTNPIVNFEAGTLIVTVEAKATVTGAVEEGKLREMLAGKSVNDARAAVLALPHLSEARISLSPFWLTKVPKNQKRVIVEIE